MKFESLDQTFVPLLYNEKYNNLNKHVFGGRHIIDLGSGPLPLLYDHAIKNGARSYFAVENDPNYSRKLWNKIAKNPKMAGITNKDITSFLRASKFFNQLNLRGNLTFVCSGIEEKFVSEWEETEQMITEQVQKGNLYLGVCSGFFMSEGFISGQAKHDPQKGIYTFQNGDNILIAQNTCLPEEVCIDTKTVNLGGHGEFFGEFDSDFEIPYFDHH